MSKSKAKATKRTPLEILSKLTPVTLNSKRMLTDGVAVVDSVDMDVSTRDLKKRDENGREMDEVQPLDVIAGMTIPRIVFQVNCCKQVSVEDANGVFTTGDEVDSSGQRVIRATQKTVSLRNIRQLRKLYGLSAPFDGTFYNVLVHEGVFYAENPIADEDVEEVEKNLEEGMSVVRLTESEFYYIRYVRRAAQKLPLEDFEYSFVKRENGITWFTEQSGATILTATM